MAGERAYLTALLEARARGFTLDRVARARLRVALQDAVRALGVDIATSTSVLTRQRARSLRREIMGVLEELGRAQTGIASSAARATATDVVAIHERVIQRLSRDNLGAAVAGLGARLDRLPAQVLRTLTARRSNAATFRTLIDRNIADAAPALDHLITSGLARSVSQRELARDVATLLESGYSRAIDKYGLSEDLLNGLTSIEYDARRISRTETMNALREANTASMVESPLVEAVAWQLNGNHPLEDECDILAETDFYGLGEGFYPPERFPLAPHPFCGCYQGEVLMRPVEEWGSPREDPGDPDVSAWAPPERWSEGRSERGGLIIRRSLGLRDAA